MTGACMLCATPVKENAVSLQNSPELVLEVVAFQHLRGDLAPAVAISMKVKYNKNIILTERLRGKVYRF